MRKEKFIKETGLGTEAVERRRGAKENALKRKSPDFLFYTFSFLEKKKTCAKRKNKDLYFENNKICKEWQR